MKAINLKTLVLIFAAVLWFSCNSQEPKLNTQEEKAVSTQVEKDQAAMDSLEKVIEAQISEMDTADLDSVN